MSARNPFVRFDEFRFFSYLFTGAALLVGLGPILPAALFAGNPIVLLAVGILFSYVLGQALYQTTAQLQVRFEPVRSHRELLADELDDPTEIHPDIIREFVDVCDGEFESFSVADDDREELLTLFPMVVSSIQLENRGFSLQLRSRYTFFRSMILVNVVLAGLYTLVLVYPGSLPFDPAYASTLPAFELVYAGVVVVLGATLPCWYFGYSKNRRHYVEYLLSDYVNLQAERTRGVRRRGPDDDDPPRKAS